GLSPLSLVIVVATMSCDFDVVFLGEFVANNRKCKDREGKGRRAEGARGSHSQAHLTSPREKRRFYPFYDAPKCEISHSDLHHLRCTKVNYSRRQCLVGDRRVHI